MRDSALILFLCTPEFVDILTFFSAESVARVDGQASGNDWLGSA